MTNLDKKLTFQLVLDRILFKAVLLLCFILASLTTFSQEIKEENYNIYHQKIIRAEKAIFIDNKIDIGFQLFSESFSEFSFVFIDDCIEAFQLAAFYKRDTLALRYLKKAIDMGFSIRMVENLKIIIKNKDNSLEFRQVTVFDSLLKANHFALEGYESKVSISYSADIKKIYKEVIERHIKEQAYKQFRRIIFPNEIDPKNSFKEANDSNMNYLLALFAKGVFLGEKNLGVINRKILNLNGIRYLTEKDMLLDSFKKVYNIPPNERIPITSEMDVFSGNILLIIYFHHPNSFELLKPYANKMIQAGYLHPREYALLSINSKNDVDVMRLQSSNIQIKDTKYINEIRAKYYLPDYEIDYAKYLFAKQNNLKLNFGFLDASR